MLVSTIRIEPNSLHLPLGAEKPPRAHPRAGAIGNAGRKSPTRRRRGHAESPCPVIGELS